MVRAQVEDLIYCLWNDDCRDLAAERDQSPASSGVVEVTARCTNVCEREKSGVVKGVVG